MLTKGNGFLSVGQVQQRARLHKAAQGRLPNGQYRQNIQEIPRTQADPFSSPRNTMRSRFPAMYLYIRYIFEHESQTHDMEM